MKAIKNASHRITYSKGGIVNNQDCFGKTDLFNCLKEMMQDGYTYFIIKTLK